MNDYGLMLAWQQLLISIASVAITAIAVMVAIAAIIGYATYRKTIRKAVQKAVTSNNAKLIARIEKLEKKYNIKDDNDDRTLD